VHGPVPRSYDYALPKKMVAGALRSALSAKLAEDKLTVVDAFALGSHKTKEFRQALSKLDADTRTILLIDNSTDVNLERASRNLAGVTLLPSTALEPYDLLRHERLMLSREAVARLSRSLSANPVEEPVQIEAAAPKAAAPEKHAEKAAPAKAAAKKPAAPKAAKKPATKKEKPKAKPKAKKG
jgi:hypothetical protein